MTTTDTTPARLVLDLALGTRPATDCGTCGKTLPALDTARFELENADTSQPLCMLCADKKHRGLRLACLLLNTCLDLDDAGDKQAAREALQAVVNGMEMVLEDAPRPRYTRPIRHQPSRSTRRGRRR